MQCADVGQMSVPDDSQVVIVRCSQCFLPLPPDAALPAARGREALGAGRAEELKCARCAGSSGGPRDRGAGRYYEERPASRSRSRERDWAHDRRGDGEECS